MGLFDWLKPKTRKLGPTLEGLYGELPKGARWTGGEADPAGAPEDFAPGPEAYVFDIVEWRWDEQLWIHATTSSGGNLAGFGLVLGLSDGGNTNAAEVWEHKGSRGLVLKESQEWTIPRGHPTSELALVSHGERTTEMLRKLEQCFGYEPLAHPALPENTAVMCELIILRGLVVPDEGRFTARMKVVFPVKDGWPYGEFFLNVNSVRKQLWVSEKSNEYRIAILTHISHMSETA
ncbi:MAG: hypothetical protein Q7T86_19500 [Hyphomicrobiaceae bacterium]|nr:hypothetical protein [Hyphomicrobiaceae bacterium]